MRSPIALSAALLVLLILTGCSDDEPPAAETPVRAIKSMVVKERAKDQLRRISGRIEADTVTDLSFEISGQLVKVNVEIGERVTTNTIIALLDAEPYQLRVDTAKGELESSQATLYDAREKYKQQKTLLDKGITSKTSFDSATATLKIAESQVKISRTSLSISERDLLKSKLVAPFDGAIAIRYVDVFSEVLAGTPIVQIHSVGNLKVEASVPESMIRNLSTGDRVGITFPTLESLTTEGTVSDISSRAGTVNAFPVEINLDNQFPELRPGMTAEVTFRFATEATGRSFLIPMTAVLPQSKGKAVVFVFDEKAGVVHQRSINVKNVRNNNLEITGEIKTGDIIATAGVSFLSDGMKVRLLDPIGYGVHERSALSKRENRKVYLAGKVLVANDEPSARPPQAFLSGGGNYVGVG